MDFVSSSVSHTFFIVMMTVVIDAVMGAIKGAKLDPDGFDIRKLPRFLATGILPYVGGLGILAFASIIIGEPFAAIFYLAAASVTAKYMAEIKDKINSLYVVDSITHDDGIGGESNDTD